MAITGMRKGKNLLLLARQFPYNNGEVAAESYLETEIGFLASRFEEIIVVGTEAPKDAKLTCVLPENVHPVALGCGNSKTDKAAEAAKGMGYRFFGPQLVRTTIDSDLAADTYQKRIFLGYFVARAYRKLQALLRTLTEFGFEPTHIYSFWLWDTALVCSWLKASYPTAVAFSRAHRYDLYQYRSGLRYLPLREFLFDHLDWVFPCSLNGTGYINQMWPGYSNEIRTAYLGTRDLPDRSGAPQGNAFRIVSCSRVVPVKRVELIADAVSILDAHGVQAEWTHFGDGEQLADVRLKISNCSNVRCNLPGAISNAALLDEYGKTDFDLFVNASESEGLPISLMEACGVGIPVVATDVGGTREIVHSGLNGELLPKDLTAFELAEAIEKASLVRDSERLALRKGARHVWENHFRAINNVNHFVDMVLDAGGR